MEDLTKTQLVLLNLFVTFVTSIATGVITVTLLQEAPTGVTQTINRVVERTIERVVSDPKPVATIQTAAPSEEELISRAVATGLSGIVRIYEAAENTVLSATSTTPGEEQFRGLGFLISRDGIIATSASILSETDTKYIGITKNGAVIPVVVRGIPEAGVVFMKAEGVIPSSLATLQLSDTGFTLGKTVVAPTLGAESDGVQVGTISALKSATASTTPVLQTTLSIPTSAAGGPLLDTRGITIGMALGDRKSVHGGVIKGMLTRLR